MRHAWMFVALAACSDLQPVSTLDDGSNAVEAWADSQGRRMESFRYGGDACNEVVDYLFVLDNSTSMKKVVGRVRKALLKLDPEAFPAESRIGVLSTVPARPGDLSRPHQATGRKHLAANAPGFGKLVSEATLAHTREALPEHAHHYPLTGCDPWFRPGDTNAAGERCLLAHTQIGLQRIGTEAGLTAVDQLLERNAGRPTFRPGASVNVVFISDTHDPGLDTNAAAALLEARPDAAELVEHLLVDNPASSIRFHAIAPQSECVEPWVHLGPAYNDAATATGGALIDMCTAEDYTPLLTKVLEQGCEPSRPVFALAHTPESIEDVLVDGESASYTRHPTLPVVEVELPTAPVGAPVPERSVEVRYSAPNAPVVPLAPAVEAKPDLR